PDHHVPVHGADVPGRRAGVHRLRAPPHGRVGPGVRHLRADRRRRGGRPRPRARRLPLPATRNARRLGVGGDEGMTAILATTLAPLALAAEPAHAASPESLGQGPSIALLILALPLLSSILCGLYAILGVRSKLPAFSTVALLALSFVMVLVTWSNVGSSTALVHGYDWIRFEWGAGVGQQLIANIGLYIDSLTILWMLFVTGLATLIALYASEYMSHDVGPGYCRFFAYFSLFVFSMSALVMADNLLLLYLGWEGVGLCSYLLIGYFYQKPEAVAAAKKAFIVNRIGDFGLALGVFATFVTFGTIEYAPLLASISGGVDGAGHSLDGTA